MEQKNCDLLFNYLKSILYDSNVSPLDIEELDPPYRKLGMGLQYLEQAIAEMKQCSAALAKGDLKDFHPSQENFLCDNLKNIHANLEHLTWQAKQVAKGDYSQHVSYLGEFSVAFNTMISQLQEREKSLKNEAEMEKAHTESIKKYNCLLMEFIRRSNDDIFVTDVHTNEILEASCNKIHLEQEQEIVEKFKEVLAQGDSSSQQWQWIITTHDQSSYRIVSILTEWRHVPAYAHFIQDVTSEEMEHGLLQKRAHFDPLTQIGNRYYFQEQMDQLMSRDCELTIVYCDLDQLKYVNDTFGHKVGDEYICHFVEAIQQSIRDYDVFARMGGDEFCIVLKDCSLATAKEKMDAIQYRFMHESQNYLNSFSYGTVHLDANHGEIDLNEILEKADYIMYRQKREHRKARK